MDEPLIIRVSAGKFLFVGLVSLAFIVVGVLMLTFGPAERGSWSTALGRALQPVVGVLAIALGVVGVLVVIRTASRPLLRLYPDHIDDVRRGITIPYTDIRAVSKVDQGGIIEMRWIELRMIDPARYSGFDRASKRAKLQTSDLILDLSLAAPARFREAYETIRQRVGAGL